MVYQMLCGANAVRRRPGGRAARAADPRPAAAAAEHPARRVRARAHRRGRDAKPREEGRRTGRRTRGRSGGRCSRRRWRAACRRRTSSTRPAMLGPGRGPHTSVVQMPSMQRTNKLQLEPDVAARIGAAKTSYEPPVEAAAEPRAPSLKTEVPEPAMVTPGSATTRWMPPADFAARLVPPAFAGADRGAVVAHGRRLDDGRAAGHGAVVAGGADPHPAARARSTPLPVSAAAPSRREGTPRRRSRARAPPSSKPPSSVETTIAGEEAPFRLPRNQGRTFLVVVVCFLVGVARDGDVRVQGGAHRRTRARSWRTTPRRRRTRGAPAVGRGARPDRQGLARSPQDPQLLAILARVPPSTRWRPRRRRPRPAIRPRRHASPGSPRSSIPARATRARSSPRCPSRLRRPPSTRASRRSRAGAWEQAPRRRICGRLSTSRAPDPGVGQPMDMTAHVQGGGRAKVEGADRSTSPGPASRRARTST